jgi:hypothetical protein
MYIFVHVPGTGRIAFVTAWNRAGPLPMQVSNRGGRARACGGRLQRRGTSLPGDTSAIEADRSSHRLSVKLSVFLQQLALLLSLTSRLSASLYSSG